MLYSPEGLWVQLWLQLQALHKHQTAFLAWLTQCLHKKDLLELWNHLDLPYVKR